MQSFNPRSRTGSDSLAEETSQGRENVSIHAPARGATKIACFLLLVKLEFQSTLPHGERLKKYESSQKQEQFQSTLPHGERRNHTGF